MPYVFRDDGPWGPGKHEDLDPSDVDGNFWQAIQDISAKAVQGVGLSNIVQVGNQITFVLTDHTLIGPFTLPTISIVFKGEWAPDYSYQAGNIITHAGSTYMVLQNHVSDATFDPGANDGNGHDFYGLLLRNPELFIPDTGPVGYFFRRTGTSAGQWAWQTAALVDLSDTNISNPQTRQVLTFLGGVWTNAAPPSAFVPDVLTRTDTTFVPALADANTYNRFTDLAGCAITIPTDASVPFPVATEIHFRQATHGPLSFEGESGLVTINLVEGHLAATEKKGATVTLKKVGTDEWDIFGLLATGGSP